MVDPIEQSRCAVPTPVKYVGAVLSLAGLIGFSTALYLGKLNRNIALIGAGVSAAGLITSIAIKGKTTTKPDKPNTEPEKVTLRFQDMNDVDTLQKLVAAIKAEENKDLQVLDLTQLSPIADYRDKGQLLVAIAEHPKLELVKFGTQEINMRRVEGWQDGLEALADGRDADVPELLKTFLGRVDFVTLPNLPNNKLLPELAKFENLTGIALGHKADKNRLHKEARTAIHSGQPFSKETKAFVKLLPHIDGAKDGWNFARNTWTPEKLIQLFDDCPNARSLNLWNVTRIWTEKVATKVQALINDGCKVSTIYADELAQTHMGDTDSPQFTVAAGLVTTLLPNDKDWTADVIVALLPHLPNLTTVKIKGDYQVLLTRQLIARLKDKDLELTDCDGISYTDMLYLLTEVKPQKVRLVGKWPDAIKPVKDNPDSLTGHNDIWKNYDWSGDPQKKDVTLTRKEESA